MIPLGALIFISGASGGLLGLFKICNNENNTTEQDESYDNTYSLQQKRCFIGRRK